MRRHLGGVAKWTSGTHLTNAADLIYSQSCPSPTAGWRCLGGLLRTFEQARGQWIVGSDELVSLAA